jgi:hypothetical protein
MQSTLRQARQDKSFQTASYSLALPASPAGTEKLSFSDGSVGTTAVDIALTTNGAAAASTSSTSSAITSATTMASLTLTDGQTITVGDGTTTNTFTATTAATATVGDLVNSINNNAALKVSAAITNGKLTLTADDNTVGITMGGTGTIAGLTTQAVPTAVNTAKSVDQLVSDINGTAALAGKIVASNDNGKLRVQNISTAELTLAGATSGGVIDGGASSSSKIGGNETRKSLVKQFNELRDQLNKTADDASFNGVNLLRADKLKLTFNETGTSTMEIQVKDNSDQAMSIDASSLNIDSAVNADFNSDDTLDSKLATLGDALGTLRSQSSSLGSKLSIVQNRQDYTKAMINTLQTGADKLVLADTNEEAANLLALQTRQQLSSTALSMASQSDQAVLRLF